MARKSNNPPTHLSAAAKCFWRELLALYDLDAHDRIRLQAACESFDRWQAARKVLDKKGTTYVDRFGAPRNRPEVSVERDSRLACLRSIRELGLDYTSVNPAGLPLLGGQTS
jgi:P27 family predicted phage terminase small subunit